jgi:hypothetical protein
MVGRTPQWEAFRIRQPIPSRLPGYVLYPYAPKTLLYQFSVGGTVYCIDLDAGQIVSEGQASSIDTIGFDAMDTANLPSCDPTDGTISAAWVAGGTISRAYGTLGRQGDTSMTFAIPNPNGGTTQEKIVDASNGPAEWVCYTTTTTGVTGQTHWYFCRKNDLVVTTINSSFGGFPTAAGVDCDRAGNWYIFASAGSPPNPTHTLIRQAINGSGITWSVNPDHTGASIPAYTGARTGLDKLVCIGPPEKNGLVWNQNVFVALPSGWLSKHDCRTGAWVIGGNTTLRPSQLNAAPDGLVLKSSGIITKVNLDTLAVIWTHTPNSFAVQGLNVGPIAVDGCGDVIYGTGADPQGAVHIRKIKSADGTPLIDRKFFLPVSGVPIVADSGRIGGYSFCGESWELAGRPPIAFS